MVNRLEEEMVMILAEDIKEVDLNHQAVMAKRNHMVKKDHMEAEVHPHPLLLVEEALMVNAEPALKVVRLEAEDRNYILAIKPVF